MPSSQTFHRISNTTFCLSLSLCRWKTNSKVNEKLSLNPFCVKVKRKVFFLLCLCLWICHKEVLSGWNARMWVCRWAYIILGFVVYCSCCCCCSPCVFPKHDVTVLSFGWHMHNNKQRFYLFKWHFSFIKYESSRNSRTHAYMELSSTMRWISFGIRLMYGGQAAPAIAPNLPLLAWRKKHAHIDHNNGLTCRVDNCFFASTSILSAFDNQSWSEKKNSEEINIVL